MNSKPHHAQGEIARLIGKGGSDRGIANFLGVDRRAVIRVRREMGVAPLRCFETVEERLEAHIAPPDADGHRLWTGSRTTGGVPRIRHKGRETSASKVVFEQRARRPSVGMVKADCGVRGCLAEDHLVDDVERRTIRLMERFLAGYAGPWSVCGNCGGSWTDCGRIEPDLTLYCRDCGTNRARARKGTNA